MTEVDKREPMSEGDYEGVISMFASEAVTWEAAVGELLSRAGEAYKRGRDEEAKLLRDLANEWKPRIEGARAKQALHERTHRVATEADWRRARKR